MTKANSIRQTPVPKALGSEPGQARARLAEASSLDDLLHHLQGNPSLADADLGLARLEARRLHEIRRLALRQAEAARRALRALRQLLLPATAAWKHTDTGPQGAAMGDALLHLYALNQELLRWRQLAARAADYLEQREAASDDARQWLREARACSEWPGLW